MNQITAVIDKGNFVDVLGRAAGVAKSRDLPICNNVFLDIKGESVTVRATDIETDMTAVVTGIKADGEAKLVLNAKTLNDMMKTLGSTPINLTSDGSNVEITQGQTKFKLASQDPEDFPVAPQSESEGIVWIPTTNLMRLIRKVSYAINQLDGRYTMTGMFLKPSDGILTAVGTDGFRLSVCSVAANESVDLGYGVIVPLRVINRLPSLIGDSEEIKISIERTRVSFSTASITVVSRLIEGAYPNYEGVIPDKTHRLCTINKEDMVFALKKAMIVAPDDWGIDVEFDGEKFQIHSGSTTDRVDETINTETDMTEPFTTIFNVKQLLDLFMSVDDFKVTVQFPEPGTYGGVVVREGQHTSVLMPIRR